MFKHNKKLTLQYQPHFFVPNFNPSKAAGLGTPYGHEWK